MDNPGPFPIQQGSGPGIQNSLTALATIVNSPNVLLAATNGPVFGTNDAGREIYNNGIFYSSDRGATWERRTYSGIQEFITNPDGGPIFAIRRECCVQVSRDGGRSFEQMEGGWNTGSLPSAIIPDRRNSSIYLSTRWRSGNQGLSWQETEAQVPRPALGLLSSTGGELRLNGSRNSPIPAVEQLTVQALGVAQWALPFTVEVSGGPWLEVSPDGGETRRALTFRARSQGLELGEHRATVRARSQLSLNEAAELEVILTVNDAPPPAPTPTIITYAGNGTVSSDGDGTPAVETPAGSIYGLALGSSGDLYTAEVTGSRVRRVDPQGVIRLVGGTGSSGHSGDGGPAAQAQLNWPVDVAAAPDGSVYIAENFARRVRRIAPNGAISTIAGDGEFGSTTQPTSGQAANLRLSPQAIAVGPDGVIYVSTTSRIYRITQQGMYTEFSTAGASGLAVGPDGAVYAAMSSAHRVDRIVGLNRTPFAGSGEQGYSGDGGAALDARLAQPEDVDVDGEGRVFIADRGNHAVRVVQPNGVIETYAGIGAAGFSGDGGPANQAALNGPRALAVAGDGTVYVADTSNYRVREIMAPGATRPEFTQAGVVNGASFRTGPVAPGQILSIFGLNLAAGLAQAEALPLPEELGGVSVRLGDHPIPLLFVSPQQINCVVPDDVAAGQKVLTVSFNGQTAQAMVTVERISPGLFAFANTDNLAAAGGVRAGADGGQIPFDVYDAVGGGIVPRPISLGGESDVIVLLLFGTGLRNWQDEAGSVEVTIGGQPVDVIGAQDQGFFAGLDQINVILPRSLAGAGEVEIRAKIGDKETNTVKLVIE